MDKLFEAFVAIKLRACLQPGIRLRTQISKKFLCSHNDGKFFYLKPDIALEQSDKLLAILDTKWKLLNMNPKEQYGLAQSDFYQLFAYGQKYMDGQGDLGPIYPKTDCFSGALPAFNFSEELRLWVLAFDLSQEKIVWNDNFHLEHPIRNFLT